MIVTRTPEESTALPKFSHKRSSDPLRSQPILVRDQGPDFVAIIQRDGGDPDTHHWVLVERRDVLELAKRLLDLVPK